jgi:hypothetical protein
MSLVQAFAQYLADQVASGAMTVLEAAIRAAEVLPYLPTIDV